MPEDFFSKGQKPTGAGVYSDPPPVAERVKSHKKVITQNDADPYPYPYPILVTQIFYGNFEERFKN